MDESGPAFPLQDCSKWQCHGMTLRDYFAAASLQGMLSCPGAITDENNQLVTTASGFAAEAYVQADAMLKARSIEPQRMP